MSAHIRSEMQAIREGLRCSTIEAIFATIHMVLTQGIFLTNYVLDLGASNMVCGIVEALPFLLQFSYFISPLLVRRLQSRKQVALFFSVTHRLAWVFLILLLYVDWSPGVKQTLMVLTLFCANGCAVIAGNAWFSWMTDLVPVSIRGSYYGRRNTYLGMTSLVMLFIGSQVLTLFREVGLGRVGYTLCFSTAIVSAIFAGYMLHQQYEPPPKPIPPFSIQRLKRALKDHPLLQSYIRFVTLWQFSLGIGAAFFGVYMVKSLKMTPAEMGYQTLIASLFALLGSRLWGRARDRVGDRAIVIASGMLISVHIWIWLFTYEGVLWPVWVTSVFGGFGWAGFNIGAFSWPQKLCGEEDRQYLFGLLGFFSGPAFMVGSLLGGILTTVIPVDLFSIGPFRFQSYHVVFALSSIGRGYAIILISRWSMDADRIPRDMTRCIMDTFHRMVR